MADKLYRSHSLEYSKENTSGSLTVWEDYPVSPFEVGDTFRPVQGGPELTVEKVSIKDNVVGELYGKPVRQWEITIEGSNDDSSSGDSQTHIKYNFNISADEKSGTMEVTNTGDNPSITLDIGDSFSVPGVGLVKCSNVKGSDDYDDEGVHSWTVIYEGTDKEETSSSLPETKYNFSIEKNNDAVIHSGSMQVVLEGDNPSFSLQPGAEFNLPGLGKVICTKISGSDEHDDSGLHTWTITYEGSDEEEQQAQEALPEIKYNFNIEKNGDIDIHTGSMTVVNEGEKPSLTIATGENFTIPGVGSVTCTKVSGSDEYTNSGSHLWTITYEGSDAPDETQSEEDLPEVKYNFTIDNDSGDLSHTGTMSVTNEGDNPAININVGSKFSVPGIGELTCTKVSGNDEYTDSGSHRWVITYEGNDKQENTDDEQSNIYVKYTFDINPSDGDSIVHSGTMEISNTGDTPALTLQIGDNFTIPGIGQVKCSNVKGSDSYDDDGTHIWSITYEGTDAENTQDEETLPETKYNFSVEKDNDNVIHSGTMQVVLTGDNPSFDINVGSEFNLPGLGTVKCLKISGSDEFTDSGLHVWTITYEGSNAEEIEQSETLPEIKYNFTIEHNGDSDIHSGSMTVVNEGDNPSLTIATGEKFTLPGIGEITCTKVSGSDEFTDSGSHIWTVTYEGTDAPNDDEEETLPEVKYNFSIEGENEDNLIHSGTVQVVSTGEAPAFDFGIGREITVPGIGKVICTKINGSDEFTDSGTHIWTVTYEGTDAETVQAEQSLPEIKYSFSIDGNSDNPEHSGSMQVVNEGENPALTLEVGSEFTIPGAGKVICTKVSGNDEYTESGSRRWTVTYEGTDKDETSEQATAENTKFSFNVETSGDNVIHSGSKQVVVYGENPVFVHNVGDTFIIPGAGEVTCTKYNGSDEYTDTGLRKWTITYEGSDAPDDETQSDETLPEAKYNLAIEKDNDGDIQKSGSMSVVSTGESPQLNISVGSTFNIPGLGEVTCSKVSASDDYTDSGVHRWTMTYEGIINETSGDDEQPDTQDTNNKYSFSIEQDSSGGVTHSGSVEITSAGNSPSFAHEVGANINLPGIGEVTCTKISGSDSYTDTGKRKWTVVYEGADNSQSSSTGEADVKYTLNIENDSEGVTVYSGSKEISCTGQAPTVNISIGDKFTLPLVGELTCTRIHSANESANVWSVVIEGSRSGGSSSGGGDGEDDTSLPETEKSVTYEINGTTTRTVEGEFVALRRSTTPITKKTITVYTANAEAVALPGSSYEGGIVTSENVIKETIKSNGVITGSYYKHTIEVES